MDIEEIKGIGAKTANILRRLNINNLYDLLTYYPFRYEYIKRSDINALVNDKIIMDGVVLNNALVTYLKNHKDKMSFRLNTGTNIFNVSIFNRGYLKNKIIVGSSVTVFGKYDRKRNMIVASDIKLSKLPLKPIIEPVYHVTTGITSSILNTLIKNNITDITDYIPTYLSEKYSFLSKIQSIKEIHNPSSTENLKQAINRLKYEELFLFMLKINNLKKNKTQNGLVKEIDYDKILEVIKSLPFELTIDQKKAIDDIYNDMVSENRMNRLIQGDVGSGKTIVSFIALYMNYLAGYQGALMAPTEILAKQHYINIKKIFPLLNIELLTGKLKVKDKKNIYNRLSKNEIDIVIGTHALISEDVKYNNLGLVVTDEQHRFGVNQRANLKNKGIMPDVLYMSATPIPRTYAITLFGDMDISLIKTKPSGRKEIITYLKKESEIKDVLMLMYQELRNSHQIYVIAPLIEESDKIELENVIKLKDKMTRAFGKLYTIDIMHGKLSNTEKEDVMERFKNNEVQILISTTVIEVGVDVSNATCMVVFDSYRFGLSALHQLRGRVGRSSLQSYFVMISNNDAERLKVLTKTSDGFLVSEEDFKLRGSGDLFGIRQSGDMQFKLADLKKDINMLNMAKADSEEFLEKYKDKYEYIYNSVNSVDNLD